MTLDKGERTAKGYLRDHLTLFFKRLRKINANVLRYYVCGEYGSHTMRPHYHLLLFNADINTIQPAWDLGYIHYGQVSGASVGYCLKYMCKEKKIPVHRNDDRKPEFQRTSKGLGANYLTDSMINWHLSDLQSRLYCVLEGGKKISLPRYYRDKIYTEDQRQIIATATASRSIERMDKYVKEMYDAYGKDWMYFARDRARAALEKMYKKSLENRYL